LKNNKLELERSEIMAEIILTEEQVKQLEKSPLHSVSFVDGAGNVVGHFHPNKDEFLKRLDEKDPTRERLDPPSK
jgi:hypothetical protein